MRAKVLAVDDEPEILRLIGRILSESGFETQVAESATAALSCLERDRPDLLLTDVAMPDMSGLELLAVLREAGIHLPCVVMSGAANIAQAVEAVKLGASDFIEKPLRAERLVMSVESCLRDSRARDANERMQRDPAGAGTELIGESPKMLELKAMLDKVAPSEGRVLILGENGTGKELVAAAIHHGSSRRAQPFVKLNCSAVPKDLVESELFGHERGAFTGAHAARRGRFELADGGTLFLDEVGDMPPEMQVKLLRVLQEGVFERVGGTRTYSVDVRVLAATNRDLEAMVAEGEFREDLYYRLAVVVLRVPPLRERTGDVARLVRAFVRDTAARNRRRDLTMSDAAVELLAAGDYPGNVRELQNLVERLGILSDGAVIGVDDVRRAMHSSPSVAEPEWSGYREGMSLSDLMQEAERRVLEQALSAYENKAAAAKALSVERSHFYKKLRRHGLG